MCCSVFRVAAAFILVFAGFASAVFAQDTLQRVKDLYDAAAYEDVLTAVKALETDSKPELEQYRAFSLVALGRVNEAEQTIYALLEGSPRYRLAVSDASPRIQDLFKRVRAQIGPGAVKRLYLEGRAALDKKDREAAVSAFTEMLATADDPDIKDQPTVAELRLLGDGFLSLSRALPQPERAAAQPVPAASPAAALPAPVMIPPVSIRETLPRWSPANRSDRTEYAGTLRVSISATGTVDHAEIVTSVHPAYDPLLLRAARSWLYQPARRDGVALPSEKTISVRLKPS